MAAPASSSSSNSDFVPLPRIEREDQDVTSRIKEVTPLKEEFEDSKNGVKREPVDMADVKRDPTDTNNNAKGEPKEEPGAHLFMSLIDLIERLEAEEARAPSNVTKEDVHDAKDSDEDPFAFLDTKEHKERMQRIEADFNQHLMNKYFSDKTLSGEPIFDQKTEIDGNTFYASRLPPYHSFLDPAYLGITITKPDDASSSIGTSGASWSE